MPIIIIILIILIGVCGGKYAENIDKREIKEHVHDATKELVGATKTLNGDKYLPIYISCGWEVVGITDSGVFDSTKYILIKIKQH